MHTATQRARANKRKADQQRSKGSGRLGGWGEAEEPDEETPSSLANLLGQGSSAATDESAASAGFAALRRSSLKRASTISLISSRASPATLERMASMTPRSLTAPDAPKPPKKSIGLSAVSAFVGDRLFSSRHGTKRGSSTTATERGSASTCEKLSVAVSTRSAEERRSAAESLDTASWLFDSARRGEVALVRASWLLRRAGFERADVDVPVPMARSARVLSPRPRTLRAQGAWVRDVSVGAPTPLPPRQTLEAECPEAYVGADELEKAYARLREKIDAATDEAGAPFPPTERESLDVAPLVLFSHCWETAAHPDPAGHTLLSIATALAGTWEFDEAEVRPAGGMPVYALWGYDEIGVYIDWCSLYQGRAPPSAPSTASPPLTRAASTPRSTPRAHSLAQLPGPPLSPRGPSTPRGDAEGGAGDGAEGGACDGPPLVRTAEQEKSYASARARTAHWFAHRKSAVCILRAQQGLLVPRRRRGWPLLEEAAARLIKRPPPPFLGHVFLPAVEGRRRTPGMRKVFLEGFPERRAVMTVDGRAVYWERTRAPGEAGPALSPTLSPSLFGAELRRRFFSVPADVDLVVAMYAELVADAFGHAPTLSCRGARWGDPEMAELAKLLREVPHPNVSHLDLSRNPHVTNLIALGSAISNGALAMLTKLDLSYCRELVALPAGIATLSALVELILEGCNAFEACPSLSGLTKLRVLNLANCLRVTALPPGVQHLRSLSSLDAWGCRALRALPDLARLRSLRTVNISYCRALGELPPLYGLSSLSTLKMRNCSAVLYLPRSVGALGSLRTLDLFGCRRAPAPSSASRAARLNPSAACARAASTAAGCSRRSPTASQASGAS